MDRSREERAASYFQCTVRERAVFDAVFKLAAVYHQFVGAPVSASNVESLERAIEHGVMVQPFVESVSVHIHRESLRRKKNEYDYQSLTGDMLDVSVVIKIEDVRVKGRLRYVEEIKYPLMYVERIESL
jgi:hypothetical protein